MDFKDQVWYNLNGDKMNRLKYIWKKIFTVDYKEMNRAAKTIAKKRKKSQILILIDMMWCGLKYGAGYSDYIEFDFDLLNAKQRKTYLTSNLNDRALIKYNDKNYIHFFNDKVEFLEKFKKYTKRDYLSLETASLKDFEQFVKNKTKICVKPINLTSGEGIEIVKITKNTNIEKLYNKLKENNQLLIEDFIVQHKEMNKLYPKSVNSLRVISFITDDNKVAILGVIIKMGTKEGVDNHSNGGLYTFVNENGIVEEPSFDDYGNAYSEHPITGTPIVGFEVPMYKEIIKLIEKAAKVVPQVRYVGWDVAITENGPIIIEGNEYCGIFQMSGSCSKTKTGILPVYRKYMDI